MIRLNSLSKSYSNKEILKDITFTFESGKVYGIVGENGAGKTTLFRCISGIECYKGDVSSDSTNLKNHIGLLTSDTYYFDKMTGEEYIYLLTDARQIQIKDLNKRNIFHLPLKEYVSTYSTGMRKKLALTALLLQNNNYFILDEPYNGIDLESSILLTEIIHRLKISGKTVLISSHIFSTLKESCDEILVLEEGRIRKIVQQEDFQKLEDEMKEKIIVKDIDKLINP